MVDRGTDRIYRERTRKLEREVADRNAGIIRERAAVARFTNEVLDALQLRAPEHVTGADFALDSPRVVQTPAFAPRPVYELYTTVLDDTTGTGTVAIPNLTAGSITAGRQVGGEKTDIGATATSIAALVPVELTSAVSFNVSQQLAGYSPSGFLSAMFATSVEADFDRQIIEAIEAVTTPPAADLAAALDAFAGSPFTPRVLVGGSGLAGLELERLIALGLRVVLDVHAAAVTVLDPAGVVLRRRPLLEQSKPDPARNGTEMSVARIGELYVSPAAVQSFAATP